MSEWVGELLITLQSLGLLGVALGLMIEIIPSEIVLAYAGYLVEKGSISFWGAVLAGVIGGIFAQLFLYWFGRYGGRAVVTRYGKYIFISEHHLHTAEKWFEKYGTGVVFSARFIPVVRHAISIPAGIAKMDIWKFILYTGIAAIPWSIGFIYLGMQLGSNWDSIKTVVAPYVPAIIVAASCCFVLYVLIARRRKG
ncbi:MAG: DedA family protein [Bacilli bacterium]